MKKKILVVSLVIAVLAVAVGGTLAWFTDTDQATNTFVIGEIDIVQYEKQTDENGDPEDFVQNQILLPIVNTTDPSADDNYIEKVVTVESVGESQVYVRTFIAVPASIADILTLDTATDSATGWKKDTTAWANVTVAGIEYAVVSFTYQTALSKSDVTPAVLNGVYLNADVDIKKNVDAGDAMQFCTPKISGTGYDFYDYDVTSAVRVLVATQGVQVSGFASAVDALDSAFGTVPTFVIA